MSESEASEFQFSATYPDLVGRVAVVTGGSRGLGAATAMALAANEVAVAVTGRDEAAIFTVVEAITRNEGRSIGVSRDCTNAEDFKVLHHTVTNELGPVDILVVVAVTVLSFAFRPITRAGSLGSSSRWLFSQRGDFDGAGGNK